MLIVDILQNMFKWNIFKTQMFTWNIFQTQMFTGDNFNIDMFTGDTFYTSMLKDNNFNSELFKWDNFNTMLNTGNMLNTPVYKGPFWPKFSYWGKGYHSCLLTHMVLKQTLWGTGELEKKYYHIIFLTGERNSPSSPHSTPCLSTDIHHCHMWDWRGWSFFCKMCALT